jgi:multidrug resistance efflux pump
VTNIKSTINGIVNKKHIEPGSVLGAGTPMFEIVNVSKLKLKVSINENQVAGLKSGNTVAVTASVP